MGLPLQTRTMLITGTLPSPGPAQRASGQVPRALCIWVALSASAIGGRVGRDTKEKALHEGLHPSF